MKSVSLVNKPKRKLCRNIVPNKKVANAVEIEKVRRLLGNSPLATQEEENFEELLESLQQLIEKVELELLGLYSEFK